MTQDLTAWSKFQNDFDSMSDAEVAYETRRSEDQLAEAEEWLEAVAAWKAAGSPRTKPDDSDGNVEFCKRHGVRP